MIRNKRKKKSGFADTKDYPHRRHPANYRRLNNDDDIEYIVFTHHPEVDLKTKKVITIPLHENLNPKERINNNTSYAYPKRYVGKRSSLGRERNDLSFVNEDKKIVYKLFQTLPTEFVRYSNKNKKK